MKKSKSALQVNPGIQQPPDVNPLRKITKRKLALSTEDFVKGIRSCNITILSQAITMIESDL